MTPHSFIIITPDLPAIIVVDADEGDFSAAHQPLLDRGVILHRPVPIKMIGRDVEQCADARIERRRKIDLERRTFDHMEARQGRRLERENRRADIAAHGDIHSGGLQHMRDKRRRRRFAVGSGNRDKGRARCQLGPLTTKKLDVANDFDIGRFGFLDRQCGSGCVSGAPGASTSAAMRPVGRRSDRRRRSPPAEPFRARPRYRPRRAPARRRRQAHARSKGPSLRGRTARPCVRKMSLPASSSHLQRREPEKGQHKSDDPEANDDLRLGPA